MGTDRCRYRRSLSFLRTGLRVEAMLRPKVLSFCGQILLGRGAWHQSAHHQDTRDVTDLHVLSPGSYECDWLSNARLSRRDTQAFARHSWRSAAIRRSCALSAAVGLAHSGSMLRFYILPGPGSGGPPRERQGRSVTDVASGPNPGRAIRFTQRKPDGAQCPFVRSRFL
jgi:hypothetical protein